MSVSAAVVGCSRGPAVGTVSGEVIYGGQPVQKGYVTFTPADGQSQTAGAEIVDAERPQRDSQRHDCQWTHPHDDPSRVAANDLTAVVPMLAPCPRCPTIRLSDTAWTTVCVS